MRAILRPWRGWLSQVLHSGPSRPDIWVAGTIAFADEGVRRHGLDATDLIRCGKADGRQIPRRILECEAWRPMRRSFLLGASRKGMTNGTRGDRSSRVIGRTVTGCVMPDSTVRGVTGAGLYRSSRELLSQTYHGMRRKVAWVLRSTLSAGAKSWGLKKT